MRHGSTDKGEGEREKMGQRKGQTDEEKDHTHTGEDTQNGGAEQDSKEQRAREHIAKYYPPHVSR